MCQIKWIIQKVDSFFTISSLTVFFPLKSLPLLVCHETCLYTTLPQAHNRSSHYIHAHVISLRVLWEDPQDPSWGGLVDVCVHGKSHILAKSISISSPSQTTVMKQLRNTMILAAPQAQLIPHPNGWYWYYMKGFTVCTVIKWMNSPAPLFFTALSFYSILLSKTKTQERKCAAWTDHCLSQRRKS